MNTTKVLHQAKLNSWAENIRDQQASNLSVVEWCKQNHLSSTQFYYWRRQLADQFVEAQLPEIVPLSAPITDSCTTDTTISNLSSLTMVCNNFLMGSGTNVFIKSRVPRSIYTDL